MNLDAKFKELGRIISGLDSVVIAFSGGVDSTFLLRVASSLLPKKKIIAVTAVSATYPKSELRLCRKCTSQLGISHKVIRTHELMSKDFSSNPKNRCYFCKKELFTRLNKIARENKFRFVIEASNLSDMKDFRPGSIAKRELNVRSPLEEARLTKEDIRKLSRKFGFVTWDKPSLACLASRIPYGTNIEEKILIRIDKAESFLRRLGFSQVRLRHYNGLCRIEVLKNELPIILKKRNAIVNRLKALGYNYISLDLEGYRTGSMNEGIKQ